MTDKKDDDAKTLRRRAQCRIEDLQTETKLEWTGPNKNESRGRSEPKSPEKEYAANAVLLRFQKGTKGANP